MVKDQILNPKLINKYNHLNKQIIIMKHLTPFIFLLFTFSLFAQEGTTLEEYRYLSKGYLYQKELGLDIQKNGYTVKMIFTTSKDAKLIGLYKEGEKETKALLVVIEEKGQAPIYVCIPNGNSEERVLSLYNLDVQRLINVESRKLYDNAIQEFLYSALNSSSEMQEAITTIPSADKMSEKANSAETQNEPVEDILVSKGGVESVMLTEPDPAEKDAVEESKEKPVVTTARASVSGDVLSRDIIVAPNVQTESDKKGTVAVKICVDMDGYVLSAKYTQRGSTTLDKELKKLAVDSASKYRFEKSDRREECGIIRFEF